MPTLGRTARAQSLAFRLFRKRVLPLFSILAFTLSSGALQAQTIKIELVNGRNGRPIANTCLNVWVGTERVNALSIPTDKNGIAVLRLTEENSEITTLNRWADCGAEGVINPILKYASTIKVNTGYVSCQLRTADYSWLAVRGFSTKEILQSGVVTANTCGKAKASPKPGELVIFVRPLTWWEKLKQ